MGPPLSDELSVFLNAYAYPAAILIAGDLTFENASFAALRTAHAPLFHALLAAAQAAALRAETPLSAAPATSLAWTLTHQHVTHRGSSVIRTVLLAQDAPAGAEGRAAASLAATTIPRAPGPDRSWEADARFKAIATGGGELGDLIRAYDWQHTSLGPISTWCANLVSSLVRLSSAQSVSTYSHHHGVQGIVLASPLPTALLWGEHLVLLYNTPYSSLTGADKHPRALGQPAQTVWPEVWDVIGAPVRAALQGTMSCFEDQFMLLSRREKNGTLSREEFYLTVGAFAHGRSGR
jgi:hypothetical protein